MVTVVNRIKLRVPVDQIADDVRREMGPVMRTLPGFQRYYFLKAAEQEAIAIIVWDTAEHANAGGAILGPTLFNQYIAPYAESQDRVVAEVIASAEA